MTYQARLRAHLAAYKRSTLGVEEAGGFKYRGREVRHGHILPVEHSDLNLLPLARTLESSQSPRLPRHRYFHHLTSSQAFTYNLFLPFFDPNGGGAPALLRALGQQANVESWELEAVPHKREATNIDALWVTDDGATTFCEVKLSENGFGKAKHDERHLEKLDALYRPVLRDHVGPELMEPRTFFASYQVLRNVWHLARHDGSRLLFLLPRSNTALWNALPRRLDGVSSELRSRIAIAGVEDVLHSLATDNTCPGGMRRYAQQLAEKYVPA